MAKTNKSSSENYDRTVDNKLGEWRKKSIELEEMRKQAEIERQKKGKIYVFFDDLKNYIKNNTERVVIYCISALIIITVLFFAGKAMFGKTDVSKYVTYTYRGADGFASVDASIDKESLKKKLTKHIKNEDKKAQIENFVDSMNATVQEKDISNGQKITVVITYDKDLYEKSEVGIKDTEYKVKAKGISKGQKIDIFSNVKAEFSGVSPYAKVDIKNEWTDDYLSGINFTADKSDNIKKGDEINIKCNCSVEDAARNGYIINSDQISVKADGLSTFCENINNLNKDILKNISKQNEEYIVKETDDNTFRMLYKATENKNYLRFNNDESADNINLENVYFLKDKDLTEKYDNMILYLYSAYITSDDTTEIVYFIYNNKNIYLTSDGVMNIEYGSSAKDYVCGTDMEELIENNIMQYEDSYSIQKFTF